MPQDSSPKTPAPRFRDYLEAAWSVIEPATLFVGGYHVDAIADHLEAITFGWLKNLVINIPPRHSKSSLVAVLWPTWEWIDQPHLRYLFMSYAQHLSVRDSLKCRDLILSDWYQRQWGDRYALHADQNQKMYYRNHKGGHRLASSVGGVGTGEGGERIVTDDPHHALDVEKAETERENVLNWWDGAMTSRANNPATVSRVIVMQRLHTHDLTGHVLEKMEEGGESYEFLVLPAEYEPRLTVCLAASPKPLAHDPRTTEGEALSPERFPTPELRKIEIGMGQQRYAGQYQQRPAPASGAVFLRAWWDAGRNRYDLGEHLALSSKIVGRFLSFDTAMKDKETSDYTGWWVADLLANYTLRLRWVQNEKLQFHDLLSTMQAEAQRWNYDGKLKRVLIEDKNSGTSAGQSLQAAADRKLAGLIEMFLPHGSKLYRARQAAQWCRLDCVELPNPSDDVPWLADFAGPEPGGKLFKFPAITHDDDIDAGVQLILYLEHYLAEGFRARGGKVAA
jgi:phage terminase large subunit-like protein